jgi:hypothetical protein
MHSKTSVLMHLNPVNHNLQVKNLNSNPLMLLNIIEEKHKKA